MGWYICMHVWHWFGCILTHRLTKYQFTCVTKHVIWFLTCTCTAHNQTMHFEWLVVKIVVKIYNDPFWASYNARNKHNLCCHVCHRILMSCYMCIYVWTIQKAIIIILYYYCVFMFAYTALHTHRCMFNSYVY